MSPQRTRLGELLLKEGLVTEEQLAEALQHQEREGGRIGDAFVQLGYVTESDIVNVLAKQYHIPFATRTSGLLRPQRGQGLEQLVPRNYAQEHVLMPISKNLNSLTVAFADPLDLIVIDNLTKMTRCQINPIVASKTDILSAIDEFYGEDSWLKEAVDSSYQRTDQPPATTNATPIEGDEELSLDRLKAQAEEAPVVRLVDLIVRQAIKDRASDIHIEPWKDRITLRYRIDGRLYEISPPAKQMHAAIVSRIKILSKLDIAEKRLPQDGAFSMTMEGRQIDFRVSSVPTLYGEKVAIRILDKETNVVGLAQIGLEPHQLDIFRRVGSSPHGLIFITGPTGSGKTTTLYALLREIMSPEKHILTIEDPVEYRLDGINQVLVRSNIGLTFASGLRAFLRQDPDIIMVGEVRDLETAEVCVQASLTGHLVLSTLHTNDAPSAVTRLIDIGVASFLVASTLSCIVAQRLVRNLCSHCKEAYEPPPEIRKKLSLTPETLLYHKKGCAECGQIGYRGRSGVYEVLEVASEMRESIVRGAPTHTLRAQAREQGLQTLWESGVKKVAAGVTSLEELMSVVLVEHGS